MSRLPQARGLKQSKTEQWEWANKSRLPQARGLKQSKTEQWEWARKVAPPAGAWIETN